jgi:hypothetical protein
MTSAVDLMTQHIVDTAIKPQPWLAVGASLCAIGALMGRKYRTETNLRSNLYVVGIADSGAGKDHARNAVKEAFIAAGLHHYLGGNRIASGAGLLAALQRQPALLFQKDEFGHFLSSIADKRRAPAYKSEIWDLLVELYTSAGGTFLGSEYADQKERPRVDIVQPCCCLYATTVPGPFWTALRQAALFDGGLARLLVFESPDVADSNLKARQVDNVPSDLIAALQAIDRGSGQSAGGGNLASVNGACIMPAPFTVGMTPEAEQIFMELDKQQTACLRSIDDSAQAAIHARQWENTAKVALILAVSENPQSPLIGEQHAVLAQDYVERCIQTILRGAEQFLADNLIEEYTKRVLRLIAQAGKAGISKNAITRKTQYLTKQQREEILQTLVISEQVGFQLEYTGAVALTRYVLTPLTLR